VEVRHKRQQPAILYAIQQLAQKSEQDLLKIKTRARILCMHFLQFKLLRSGIADLGIMVRDLVKIA
jgi:hypothetical protein